MTTEYDELLARLDDRKRYGDKQVDQAAAAIRALTAQVVERDAVIEQASKDCDVSLRVKLSEAGPGDAAAAGVSAAIQRTLLQAPRDALAAHDKTVRATAWEQGYEALRKHLASLGHELHVGYSMGLVSNPYRDRADREEAQR